LFWALPAVKAGPPNRAIRNPWNKADKFGRGAILTPTGIAPIGHAAALVYPIYNGRVEK
jgi:hypothetical protein